MIRQWIMYAAFFVLGFSLCGLVLSMALEFHGKSRFLLSMAIVLLIIIDGLIGGSS